MMFATACLRVVTAAVILALVGTTGTPAATATPTAPPIAARAVGSEPGPHSPAGRKQASTTITRVDGTVVRSVDLGDVELGRTAGQYRAPVRGVLVTPAGKARSHARLIVVSHLRFPGCAGDRFAYPCPNGRKARRFDRGMTYLGVALARRGYSVLIPDLGALYVGGDLADPYDQRAGLRKIVRKLLNTAVAASAGRRTRWGPGLRGDIDASHVGLMAHSRSGTLAHSLTRAWEHSSHPITSIMTYGPAYDIYYHGDPGTSPMVPDVPYLGIVGDQDQDTPYMAPMWLTHHIAHNRRSPALVAVVPGLGHTFINRTLSSAGIDDRICGTGCSTAAEHRRFLTETAASWFDATVRHRPTGLPLGRTDALPPGLSGLPVRWLAATNRNHATVFLAGKRGTLQRFGEGARARTCYPTEPMAPYRPGNCPIPALGVSQNAAKITQVTLTPDAGVVLRTPPTRRVISVVLQLAPSGDRADQGPGSPLHVRVRFADGRHVDLDVPATDPAIVNRTTPDANGTYTIGTVRLRLPRWAKTTPVVAINLTGATTTSKFDIRAIDLTQRGRRKAPRRVMVLR